MAAGAVAPEPPFQLIAEGFAKGRVIPFLGAGASLAFRPKDSKWARGSAFVPSASELAHYLDRASGYPSSDSLDLPRVSQYFDGVAGRGALDIKLHEVFAGAAEPNALHDYLAGLPLSIIVTTNYDDLLEEAFRRAKRPYNVVVYRSGLPKVAVLRHDTPEIEEVAPNELDLELGKVPLIFKMHGTIDRQTPDAGSYVITEDDYVEFLARMASQTAIPALFAEPFIRSHFLFLGYGLRDWNLRVILHKISTDWGRRRFAAWAIQSQAQPLEREFWIRRHLTIYEMDLGTFVARMTAPPEAAG